MKEDRDWNFERGLSKNKSLIKDSFNVDLALRSSIHLQPTFKSRVENWGNERQFYQ